MKNAKEYKERLNNAEIYGGRDYLYPEEVSELRHDVKERAQRVGVYMLPNSNNRATYAVKNGGTDGGYYLVLTSYYTDVAKIDDGKLIKLWDGWSATTKRHIDEFCRLFNMPSPSKYQWIMTDVGAIISER